MTTSVINVIDRNGVHKGVLSNSSPLACPFYDDIHREVLDNTLSTFTFKVPADYEVAEYLEVEGRVLFRDLDGFNQLYTIKEINDYHTGEKYREIYCEHSATGELVGVIVRPTSFSGSTARNLMNNILDGTGWEAGQIDFTDLIDLNVDSHKTVLEVLHEVASYYEGELEYSVEVNGATLTHKYINLRERRGQYTGKTFEYSKDLQSVQKEEDSTNLVTALIGIGKEGLSFEGEVIPVDPPYVLEVDYVADTDAFQRFNRDGKHIFGYYKDESEDTSTLFENTLTKLKELAEPVLTYTCEVALLERLAGFEFEKVRLGDTILVKDFEYNPPLVLEARVVEMERSLSNPTADRVVLGDYVPIDVSDSSLLASLQNRITVAEGEYIIKQPTPPTHEEGRLWMDTTSEPNILYRSESAVWVRSTPTEPSEVKAVGTATATSDINASPDTTEIIPDKLKVTGADSISTNVELDADRVVTGTFESLRMNLPYHLLNTGFIVSDNTPLVNQISWSNLTVTYKGNTYTVADGVATDTDKYLVWKLSAPTVLTPFTTSPALADGDAIIFLNKDGIATVVPQATAIDGDVLVDGTITAEKLQVESLEAVSATIGNISNTIVVGSSTYDVEITAESFKSSQVGTSTTYSSRIEGGVYYADIAGINYSASGYYRGGAMQLFASDTFDSTVLNLFIQPTYTSFASSQPIEFKASSLTGYGKLWLNSFLDEVELQSDEDITLNTSGALTVEATSGVQINTDLSVSGASNLNEVSGTTFSSTLGYSTSSGNITTGTGYIDGHVKMDLLPSTLAGRNGWASHPTYLSKYSVDSQGIVHLEGLLVSGTQSNTLSAFQLPVGARPYTDQILYAPDYVGDNVRIRIVASTGYGYIETFGKNPYESYICLNGLYFVSSSATS